MGFFLNLLVTSMWYAAFLAIQFVLVLHFEWKQRRIAWCVEPLAHLLVVLSVGTSVGGLTNDVFNPLRDLPGWCWYSDNPPFCAGNKDNQQCQRGQDYENYNSISANIIGAWIVIIICMTLIVLKVRQVEQKLLQYTVQPHTSSATGQGGATANTSHAAHHAASAFTRTRATARQSLLYIGAFFVVFLPPVILELLPDNPDGGKDERGLRFFLAVLVKVFTPLQGLFNAIIYFRRRFADLIKDGKSLAFVQRLPVLGEWIHNKSQRSHSNTTASHSRRRQPAASAGEEEDGGRLQHTTMSTPQVAISDPVHTATANGSGSESSGNTTSDNVPAGSTKSLPPSDHPSGDDELTTGNDTVHGTEPVTGDDGEEDRMDSEPP